MIEEVEATLTALPVERLLLWRTDLRRLRWLRDRVATRVCLRLALDRNVELIRIARAGHTFDEAWDDYGGKRSGR